MGRMQLDLFEYAQEIRHARQARPQAAWEEPGVMLWERAWLENVMRGCLFPWSLCIPYTVRQCVCGAGLAP